MEKANEIIDIAEKYSITIHDKHVVYGEKSESTTSLVGDLALTPDGYTISYTEHSGDFAGTTTNIKVTEPTSVQLSRGGKFSTELLLELKKRHNCHYDTPYGGIMMGVYAHRIDSKMDVSGGKLEFAYSLDVGGGEVSENELHIEVKEIKDV